MQVTDRPSDPALSDKNLGEMKENFARLQSILSKDPRVFFRYSIHNLIPRTLRLLFHFNGGYDLIGLRKEADGSLLIVCTNKDGTHRMDVGIMKRDDGMCEMYTWDNSGRRVSYNVHPKLTAEQRLAFDFFELANSPVAA